MRLSVVQPSAIEFGPSRDHRFPPLSGRGTPPSVGTTNPYEGPQPGENIPTTYFPLGETYAELAYNESGRRASIRRDPAVETETSVTEPFGPCGPQNMSRSRS